jgi:integrase
MAEFRLYVPDDRGITVGEVVEAYLAALAARVEIDDYDGDAFLNVQRELERFAAAHDFAVADCKQHDLSAWLDANPSWKSAHTKKRIVRGIVGCFRWATDEELIDRCPYRQVKAISALPYEPRRPADKSEYMLLMRKGSRALRRALLFLRRTGARTKEMREIRWPDCHIDDGPAYIFVKKPKTRRKSGSRKIGLDPGMAAFLRALRRQDRDPNGLVFTNCDGTAWTRRSFALHLRRYALKLGLDNGASQRISAYCFRHTYTVDAIKSRVSDRRICDQLGLASAAMLDKVYGSHTRNQEAHLADVAKEVQDKRRRD